MTVKDFMEKTKFDSKINEIYFNKRHWGSYYKIFLYKHKNILVEFFGNDTITKIIIDTNEDGSLDIYIYTNNY